MGLYIPFDEAFQFLKIEQVRELAPSAFTTNESIRISHKYIDIYTPQTITDLQHLNWLPVRAYQVRPKRKDNDGFQKHFVAFRNDKLYEGTDKEIESIPEILLVNSYDARCSFKLLTVVHRTASNIGVVLNALSIPHKGEGYKERKEMLQNSIDTHITGATWLLNEFKKIELTVAQQKIFAQECVQARWDYTYKLLDPQQLTYPIRSEDKPRDLCTLYYVVQEKLVSGGWIGAGGRAIKPLVDPNRELNVSVKLFRIVENFYFQILKRKI